MPQITQLGLHGTIRFRSPLFTVEVGVDNSISIEFCWPLPDVEGFSGIGELLTTWALVSPEFAYRTSTGSLTASGLAEVGKAAVIVNVAIDGPVQDTAYCASTGVAASFSGTQLAFSRAIDDVLSSEEVIEEF